MRNHWHPDEGPEDDSSMTEQGLAFAITGVTSLLFSPILFILYLMTGVPKHGK